ncbi:MAG: galactokinase [Thermodesulfobacteriota bacterium]
MDQDLRQMLETRSFTASAPCRIDLGGTLDISSIYYPLLYLAPATFNAAIDMRTRVFLHAHTPGMIKISSRGFESAEFALDDASFDHPMGLMFAIAAYFRIDGIHIQIESASPPKSALGGSSAAAVSLVAAYSKLLEKTGQRPVTFDQIPLLAHAIEESIAGVPCGLQDHLAAVYGGVNAWYWKGRAGPALYARQTLLEPYDAGFFNDRMVVAYCGVPHESKDVNGIWIRRFIDGTHRRPWIDIANITAEYIDAFARGDLPSAVSAMNRETDIRRELTPQVLDDTGEKFVAAARQHNCGARFTGAGGGGCIWAFGDVDAMAAVKAAWQKIADAHEQAAVLEVGVDMKGLE